jgi:hypothetical protein
MSQEVLAFGGKPDSPTSPAEERHADFRLKRLDLPGQGRLAKEEPVSRPAEAAGIGDCRKGAQVT